MTWKITWNQIGTKLEPQYRLDKNRLDKDSNNILSTSVDGANDIFLFIYYLKMFQIYIHYIH